MAQADPKQTNKQTTATKTAANIITRCRKVNAYTYNTPTKQPTKYTLAEFGTSARCLLVENKSAREKEEKKGTKCYIFLAARGGGITALAACFCAVYMFYPSTHRDDTRAGWPHEIITAGGRSKKPPPLPLPLPLPTTRPTTRTTTSTRAHARVSVKRRLFFPLSFSLSALLCRGTPNTKACITKRRKTKRPQGLLSIQPSPHLKAGHGQSMYSNPGCNKRALSFKVASGHSSLHGIPTVLV